MADRYLARIDVMLRPLVNDPQGLTVLAALKSLGVTSVSAVRMGKYLELSLEAPNHEAASAQVQEMCRQLLANPVIEQFRFDLEEQTPARSRWRAR